MVRARWFGIVPFLISLPFPLHAQEVYFSPKGGCAERIIQEIDRADSLIDVAMYSFTSEPIAEALVRAFRRGVRIRVLLDKGQAGGKYSKDEYLAQNGIEVVLDRRRGKMHNKFCIIDRNVLITGSYNWTKSAEEENQENMLVFEGSQVVEIYQERFDYLWELNKGTAAKPSTWGGIKRTFSLSVGTSFPGSGINLELRLVEQLSPWLLLTQGISFSSYYEGPYLPQAASARWEVAGRGPKTDLLYLTFGPEVLLGDVAGLLSSGRSGLFILGGIGSYRLGRKGKVDGLGGYVGLRLHSQGFFLEMCHHSIAFPGGNVRIGQVKVGMEFKI